MSKSGPNEHVLNYLHYYCEPANESDFAVLVTGPWGVGKTTLIERFIDDANKRADKEARTFRPLFVSLYGMTSTQEVDDELFRQLHPVLSSKTMKIGWNIFKGSLKAALKIDLEGKEELTVNSSLPDIDLSKYLKTPADALLIFDDLERCSMPVAEVLGYINTFVERNSFKVIIIANEVELLKREAKGKRNKSNEGDASQADQNEGAKSYTLIKEKLIGQTLEVRPSVGEAMKSFLKDIRHVRAKSLLRKYSSTVLDIHASSKTDNLRLLKHALWDYERLARCLRAAHWSNGHAMGVLLKVTLVLAIEVRAGRISRDDVPSLGVSEIVRLMRARDSEDTSVAGQLAARYPNTKLDKSPLEFKQLERLLFEGWVSQEDVRQSIDESPYYALQHEPPWLTAWRGWEITDDVYLQAVSKVEAQFRARQFQSNDEMLHIFGLRLFFSEIGAINTSKSSIVEECKDCLDDLMKAGRIEERSLDSMFKVGNLYCLNHQVNSAETQEFEAIFAYYEKLVEQVKAERLPAHGQELLEHMKVDPLLFFQLLAPNNVRAATYWDVPILAVIPAGDFVDSLLKLSSDSQSTVFSTLKSRYETGLLESKLKPEADWLKSVVTKLLSAAGHLPPLSRFRINQRVAQNLAPFLRSHDGVREGNDQP